MLVGAHESVAGGWHRALDHGREDGCECIQVFTKNPNQWAEPALEQHHVGQFRTARAGSSIGRAPVLAHGSYLINLCSPRGELRARSIAALLAEVQRCETLGVDAVVLHPGAHMGTGLEAGLKGTAAALAHVLEQSTGAPVRLLLENTAGQGTVLGARFEQLGALLRGVDGLTTAGNAQRLGVCLDTCHAFVAGYDMRTRRDFGRMWDDLDRHVGLARLGALHLNDTSQALGSHRDRHCRLGEGQLGPIPFWIVMNDPALRELPGVLETPPDGKDRAFARQLEQLRALRGRPAPRG